LRSRAPPAANASSAENLVTRSALFDLEGQGALVTGASRGMGLAIARELGLAGARVILASNEREAGVLAAQGLRELDIDATAEFCDVASRDDVTRLAEATIDRLGGLDVLVCHAGGAPHIGSLASASDADWDLTMNLNIRSPLWLTSLTIPSMVVRGGGSVIITSSLSSVRGNKALGLYGLSKAANAQLARNLAVEWGPANVRVNAISPGVIGTEFARPLTDNSEVMERRLALTPLRRVGTPDEVAGVVVMLASPAGAFITGQNLIIDGGTIISDGN
jgi:NAD(P)-dependent dehydrogenase (short-subunit alcohol dehydrogenase family)